MSKYIVKKKIGVIHCIAECNDCGKVFENYKNAQAVAFIHAQKYGHLVKGDVGLFFEYDGKETNRR